MIIKLLSIIVLIQAATSKPQFNFGGLGNSLNGNAAKLPAALGSPNRPLAGGSGLGGILNEGLSGVTGQGGLLESAVTPSVTLGAAGLKINLGFGDFKSIFNKTYVDAAEEQFRQNTFLIINQAISSHNDLFEKGIEKFSLAVNQFADWTESEYLDIMGVDLSKASSDEDVDVDGDSNINRRKTRASDTCQSPDSKDWRKDGAVTSVKDQLKCASCWAFSAAGALEGQFFLKNGKINSLSEQQFIDCSKQLGNKGCNKGFMKTAFEYSKVDGIVTEDEYPYEAKDSKCRAKSNSMKIQGVGTIPKGNEKKLKDAVCSIGPVAAALDATDQKFMLYHNGVYFNNNCNSKNTTHAVLVVGYGYDESTQLDYWLIKNSFGETWGQKGYGKIARNEKNHCGIANLASYPIV